MFFYQKITDKKIYPKNYKKPIKLNINEQKYFGNAKIKMKLNPLLRISQVINLNLLIIFLSILQFIVKNSDGR